MFNITAFFLLLLCLSIMEVTQVAPGIFCFQLFETSAKDDSDCDHVEAIFLTLAHKLKAAKPMMPISPSQFPDQHIHRAHIESVGRERNGIEVNNSETCYC